MGIVSQESFGSLVRRYRRDAELTQEALAERAGLSVRAIRAIETGSQHHPRLDTVQLLLAALDVSTADQAAFLAAAAQMAEQRKRIAVLPATSVRTFLVADIRNYTRFTVEQGDEAAAALTADFAAIARTIVSAHQGAVIELRGDEALAVFTSARQALRAAVALQEQFARETVATTGLPFAVGIGLDAGEALPVEGGYRGGALNLAARLCSLAGPGEVLASEGVAHLAGKMDRLRYGERGAVQLKGFAEPVRVVQVLVEAGGQARAR
jgi:class 3 adenylate cyclase